jgi:hypothetical protein
MATGMAVGGDVEQARAASASLATSSTLRESSGGSMRQPEQLVGDVRGRHFTSVVAPEDNRRARELFARKVLGKSPTEATGVFVSTAGTRVAVEVSSVPLMNGERLSASSACSRDAPTTRP